MQVVRTRGNVRAAGRQLFNEVRQDGSTLLSRGASLGKRAEAGFNLASPMSVKELVAVGAGAAALTASILGSTNDHEGRVDSSLGVNSPTGTPSLSETPNELNNRVIQNCTQACVHRYGDFDGDLPGNGSNDIGACVHQCVDDVMA